jgi:hypothetical protein
MHQPVAGYERSRVIEAAQAILSQGGWCVLESCLDVPGQRWEARVLIFDLLPDGVAAVVEDEIAAEPDYDARLTGCDRRTLVPNQALGAHLCYVTETPAAPAPAAAVAEQPAISPSATASGEGRGRQPG